MVEMAHAAGSSATVRGAPSTMWQDSGIDKRSRASRAEGRSSGSSADQEPNSPRSKHSATEQRRRTKINDRLDVLRELLPNCNQKRDKASFLLEVIEYIRHLQERCHKYESAVPDKNHVDAKSMPWDKVYYRSRWMNAQNISQVQGGGLSTTGENMNKEQHSSKSITAAPAPLFSTQSVRETSTTASSSHNITENGMPSNQPPWLSMSTMNQNCDASNRTLSKHEPPSHHSNSQSLSSAYSQGLLYKLKEALQKSGVDPSQANISVEINMDRRARANAHTDDNSKANEGKEPIHIAKRLRCDRS
ncbi:transcription factor BIM2-like [Lolium rigidum]|uniref:transcription factor BIM2-like n=1 Tax=Lolium rigidum TaxID=89674 RepID=UPI001F5DBF41|nr:transcription factor BIM2-like [Lolium rigidum]